MTCEQFKAQLNEWNFNRSILEENPGDNIAQLANLAGRVQVTLTDSGEKIVYSDKKGNGYSEFADGSWLDWNNAQNQAWPDRGTWAANCPEAAEELEKQLAD